MSHLPKVYKTAIPVEVRNGTTIILKGKVKGDTTRFDIELISRQGNVPLHSSFRFNEDCIVRNHLMAGYGWGHEERGGGMPLWPGMKIKIEIKITWTGIVVTINTKLFYNFNHRLPMRSISSVAVYGGITISRVEFY